MKDDTKHWEQYRKQYLWDTTNMKNFSRDRRWDDFFPMVTPNRPRPEPVDKTVKATTKSTHRQPVSFFKKHPEPTQQPTYPKPNGKRKPEPKASTGTSERKSTKTEQPNAYMTANAEERGVLTLNIIASHHEENQNDLLAVTDINRICKNIYGGNTTCTAIKEAIQRLNDAGHILIDPEMEPMTHFFFFATQGIL